MNFVATMIPFGIFYIAVACLGIYLTVLVIKALRKYLKSEPVRKEKQEAARNLGEVLKQHRVDCKMTQEFVAESLGVSRQAVSDNLTRTEALLRKMEDSIGCVGRDLKNRNALRTILDAAERLKTYPDETVSALAGEIIEAAQDFEE